MSYIAFVLGILLAVVGGLSVYDGYGIVTIERGWTEVIAGTVALTGGIVTISLGMILHRLQALFGLYKGSMRALPASGTVAYEPVAYEPAPISAVAPPVPAAPRMPFPMPSPLAATTANVGSPLDVPGISRPPAPPPVTPPPPARPIFAPEPASLEEAFVSSATFEETQHAAAALDHDEFQADQQADQSEIMNAIDSESAVLHATPDPLPLEEGPAPQTARPTAAALSLDEMWKRVSEEIDRPFLTSEPASPPLAESEAPAPEHWDVPAEEAAAASAHFEVEELTAAAVPAQHAAEVPADAATESLEAAPPSPEPVEMPADESFMPPPHIEPPVVEPAVIGRYEAEGTAYLMFDDGSIEAQSEGGIFKFASMAELKAFIEDKQAVEP